ncbi:ABC transporter permease, partial [bacterium]
ILRRVLVILLTIVVGVFITVVMANRGGAVDQIAKSQADMEIRGLVWQGFPYAQIEARRSQIEAAAGINLPFWPKHLLYTYKALTLSWGNGPDQAAAFILSQLPNTLLLSGTAYLLLMLIGIPLALFLSQHEGGWQDRLTAMLTPISSVPSWVIGILLVMLFAVQFRLFPVAKMTTPPPPQTTWELFRMVAYHMVLPAASILLSLIFQLVANWRTFLLLYSEEDYVDLARAKGLRERTIQSRYILRPVLPYLLTGLALTLVGFWQNITALEFFFDWPGIGRLFVKSLPNFKGESMYPGEMSIMIGIVVLFAYLLGITVFALDFAYTLVDPRLRLGGEGQQLVPARQPARKGWLPGLKDLFARRAKKHNPLPRKARQPLEPRLILKAYSETFRAAGASLKRLQHEISRSPGAVVGLCM